MFGEDNSVMKNTTQERTPTVAIPFPWAPKGEVYWTVTELILVPLQAAGILTIAYAGYRYYKHKSIF